MKRRSFFGTCVGAVLGLRGAGGAKHRGGTPGQPTSADSAMQTAGRRHFGDACYPGPIVFSDVVIKTPLLKGELWPVRGP